MITQRPLLWWVKSSNLKLQILLLLIILITVVARVLPIEMQKRIVDEAIRLRRIDLLLLYCAAYIFAVLTATWLKFLMNLLQTRIGQQALARMRKELYLHIITLPLEFFQKSSPGMVVSSLVTELATAGDFVGQAIAVPIGNLLTLVAFAVYMFYLNPLLAILSISTYPIALLLIPIVQKKSNDANKARVDGTRTMSNMIDETVSGIHEIHANASYRVEERKFGDIVDHLFKIRVMWIAYKGAAKVLNNFFQNLGPFILFLVGGYLAINGRFDLGALVAFLSAYEKLYDPWKELMDFYQLYQDAHVGYTRIMEYFDTEPGYGIEPDGRAPFNLHGAVNASRLSLAVDGDIELLKSISLDVKPGERIALVGYSGSGKSTLTRCISQLYGYSSGSLKLDEHEVSQLSKMDIAANLGIVSQNPFIFHGTIRENLLYSWEAVHAGRPDSTPEEVPSYERIIEMLRGVGLFGDVVRFGLNRVLRPGEQEFFVKKIIRIRIMFQEHFGEVSRGYSEYFDQDKFLKFSTVAANILMGSPNDPEFSMDRLAVSPFFNHFLAEAGLRNPLIELGKDLVVSLIEVLGKMPPNEAFFRDSPLLPERLEEYGEVCTRIDEMQPKEIGRQDALKLLDVALRYIPGKHGIIGMPSILEGLILKGRKSFREKIMAERPDAISFYNILGYIHSLPLLDNILFGKLTTVRPRARERISESIVQFLEKENLLGRIVEIGLRFDVGSKGERLSGGQKQKLAIARVLLKSPRILILDEATSALDNASQQQIQDLLESRWKGKCTIISVAHRLDTVREFDRIAVMRAGKIVEIGTYDELISYGGILYELVHGTKPRVH
ncbi:MAG: ABC transporter ATP-binding protein/permease [Syntrophobacteraceae bacterium]